MGASGSTKCHYWHLTYKLVYGRNPRGPLHILDYLQDLKTKLEGAAEFAEQHTKGAQENYAAYYNLRAREKKFQEGD